MARAGGMSGAKARFSRAALGKRLAKIRLLALDVDGVLTDGGLYYADDGRVMRKFSVRDGVGIKRAIELGIEVAFVSAGKTDSIRARAKALGVRHVFQGVEDKWATLATLARELGIAMTEIAHIGDDLNDVPLLREVGLPITVPGAAPEARRAARYVTASAGGAGAVREVCDLLVAARGVAKTTDR